jgi:hypothetical protein
MWPFTSPKQRMHLGNFAGMFITALLQRKYDFSELNGVLSEESKNRLINKELEYFKVVLFAWHLTEISKFGKKRYSGRDIAELIGYGTIMACRDIGKSEEEVINFIDTLMKRFDYYSDSLSKINEAELNAKGIYFYLITFFTNLMVVSTPIEIIKNDIIRTEHFAVFNLATQVYKDDEKVLFQVLKTIKFTELETV